MPKRTDIKSVMVVGSGPIVIGHGIRLFGHPGLPRAS